MPDLYDLFNSLKENPYLCYFIENYDLTILALTLTYVGIKIIKGKKINGGLEDKLK